MKQPGAAGRLVNAFLRGSFYLFYHQFAWTYDVVAAVVSLGLWDRWIETVIPLLDEFPILEIGFGRGHLQEKLIQLGAPVFGLDESKQMAHLTRKRLSGAHLHFNLVRSFAQHIPFKSATFKRVVTTFPSEYIAHPDTISEIWRLLQPGGRLIVMPTAWITGVSMPHRLAAGVFRVTNESPPKEHLIFTWIRTFEERLIKADFRVHGDFVACENSEVYVLTAEKPEQTM